MTDYDFAGMTDDELNEAIAREVMGWWPSETRKSWWRRDHWSRRRPRFADWHWGEMPVLVDRLARLGYTVRLEFEPIGRPVDTTHATVACGTASGRGRSSRPPRALAEAALMAVRERGSRGES